jgi:hypothetical protein
MIHLKHYTKKDYQTTVPVSNPRGQEVTYPFQWLLYKPQAHAVEPFQTNQASRNDNTTRSGDRTHAGATPSSS